MQYKLLILLVLSNITLLKAQDNIADAKANYGVDDVVTVTGIITTDSQFGSVRYLQDETGGIALYPGSNWDSFSFIPAPGDEISISGTLSMFANLIEVGPNITNLTLISAGNDLPEPFILTPNELTEAYEGRRVRVNGVTMVDGGNLFGSSTYTYVDQNEEEGIVYINSSTTIVGELIPLGTIDIVGVLSQFSFDNPSAGYQMLPATMADFISEFPINFTSSVIQLNLNTSSITLEWSTDVESSTGIHYGLTPDFGQDDFIDETVQGHEITIEGLESGTPYYCRVFSVAGPDTAFSNVGVYSTVSESSGAMRVYFTRNVDNNYSTGVDAVSLFSATDDTIIAQIDRAQTTLDIAVYNNNSGPIVQAINNAYDRGVTIRYIAEGQNANTALASLNDDIPVLYRMNATGSGMHNKFVIVDANKVDSALVLTGSTNFTSNNMFSDPNNMVIIQDQALARAYTLEFNEMWGSEGPEPNVAESRFGEDKVVNTPKKFIIGGKEVELYFSPSDNTTAGIKTAIMGTDYNLDFALLTFNSNVLADAVIERTTLFITPRGIVEQPYSTGSDFDYLASEGVTMFSHEGISGQLHHKYATIDYSEPLSDPTVVTGSHNWSSSAESVNDENTLVIHDATIANLYLQEFQALVSVVSGVEEFEIQNLTLYPNPASDNFTILFDSHGSLNGALTITDTQGKAVFNQNFKSYSEQNKMELYIGSLPQGVYMVSLSGEWGRTVEKLVVVKSH